MWVVSLALAAAVWTSQRATPMPAPLPASLAVR
jgi:hypothetical protein